MLVCMMAVCACQSTLTQAPPQEDESVLAGRGARALREQDYATARRDLTRAVERAREQRRDADAAPLLVQLAAADEGLGDYASELAHAREAQSIAARLGDRATDAAASNRVSFCLRQRGEIDAALDEARRALAIAPEQDADTRADSLRNISAAWVDKGGYDAATPYLEQALATARARGSDSAQARALGEMGLLYEKRGDYVNALTAYRQSLALRDKTGDRTGAGRMLGDICIVQMLVGDAEGAQASCTQSLEIARLIGDRALEAGDLNNLGDTALRQARYASALNYYAQSIAIKRALGDRPGEARALGNVGVANLRLERYDAAADALRSALSIREALADVPGQSNTHLNLGYLYLAQHRSADALVEFQMVLGLEGERGRPEVEWRAFDGLSQLYATGDFASRPMAIVFGKAAVNTIQTMRAKASTLDQQLQAAFLTDKLFVYRRLADLLVSEGRFGEAMTVLDMLKQQELFDYVRGAAPADPRTARATSSNKETDALADYAGISRDLVARSREKALLVSRQSAGKATDADKQRLAQIDGEFKNARGKFNALPQQAFGSNESSIRPADVKDLQSIGARLAEWKHGSVMLTYFFASDQRLRAFLSAPDDGAQSPPVLKDIDIDRAQLAALTFKFASSLKNASAPSPAPEASKLYDLLVRIFEPELKALDAHVILVYQDSFLRYIPFAALYDGHGYLVQRFAFVTYLAESRDGLSARPQKAKWRAAAFGVTRQYGNFPALANVPDELAAIVGKPGTKGGGVFPGSGYLDGQFTEQRLQETLALHEPFPIVHVASHYMFDPDKSGGSFLLLGDGRHLTLDDIVTGEFSFAGIDLLTLSACETARPSDTAEGHEVEGLAGSVLEKGAKAVLATLWPVADRSTAQFMATFYRESVKAGQTKGEALRAAQLALLTGKSGGAGSARAALDQAPGAKPPQQQPAAGFANPYFWAPFVLMGNWL
ncbi:hypothetical protein CR51_36300 [Caballeronia megalochromosomata]|nr:hypothetical protein CR51_36300 [Caballeronia megalochromosomata]